MGYIYLGNLSWVEAREVIRDLDFVILPTGSFEQHGPHLPLLTDSIRAEEISRRLAEKAGELGLNVGLLPTLKYGVSEHHMNFPGTITIRPEIYIGFIEDIGASLARHGVRRLAIVNFHGGNNSPLQVASSIIRSRHGLRTYIIPWTRYAREYIVEYLKPHESWGHACEHETSMIMALAPDLVKRDKIARPKLAKRPEIDTFLYFNEFTDTGGLGDPLRADPEKARIIIDKANEKIAKLMLEIARSDRW